MILIWVLGFTHFLGGPYFLFKIMFWIAMLPYIIALALIILVGLNIKAFTRSMNTSSKTSSWIYRNVLDQDITKNAPKDAVHVDAVVKE